MRMTGGMTGKKGGRGLMRCTVASEKKKRGEKQTSEEAGH